MKRTTDEKVVYFRPGDVVELKQKSVLSYSPVMYVIGNENKRFITNEKDDLKGIRCRWFSKNLELCEGVFSTKDLVLIKPFNQ